MRGSPNAGHVAPLDDAITVFTGDPGDVAVSASHDSTPGFERDYVMRSTDFYNTITYELVDSALVEIEVPTDCGSPCSELAAGADPIP